jgi:hypothetical protein
MRKAQTHRRYSTECGAFNFDYFGSCQTRSLRRSHANTMPGLAQKKLTRVGQERAYFWVEYIEVHTVNIATQVVGKRLSVSVMRHNGTNDVNGKIARVFMATQDKALISGLEVSKARRIPTRAHTSKPAARSATSEIPRWSDAFVDSVGINTHFNYLHSPYTAKWVSADLIASHIRHLRDTATLNDNTAYYNKLASLATSGIHSDLIADYNESASNISSVISLARGSVEFIEYPNEWDLNGGSGWAANILSYGMTLYSHKAQFRVSIIGPSFTSAAAYTQTYSMNAFASYADSGNVHDYFGSRNPDRTGVSGCNQGTIGGWISCCNKVEPHPVFSTETGWDDGATYHNPNVTPSVQARYEIRALLAHWNAGIGKTFLYELVDEGGESFGLIDGALRLKPSYYAVKSLLADLADPGSRPRLTPLLYSLEGAISHTLLQKRNGEYHVLMWVPVGAEDPTMPSVPVKVTLTTMPTRLLRNVWQDSGRVATTTLAPATTISLNVTDRVTELVLK